jgi:hypothetical protein
MKPVNVLHVLFALCECIVALCVVCQMDNHQGCCTQQVRLGCVLRVVVTALALQHTIQSSMGAR